MEKLTGFVDRVLYENKENGYVVFILETEDEDITCTGNLSRVDPGESVTVMGEFTEHPSYGPQFSVKEYMISIPEDIISIRRYLQSGAVKGVGAALGERIIKRFGKDTLRIMSEEPERLAEIKGISERLAVSIGARMEEKQGLRSAMLFLSKYGISNQMAARLYNIYKDSIYNVINENPYRMVRDVRGVGFLTADSIAMRVGISVDSDYRIASGIIHVLNEAAQRDGHVCLPWNDVRERSAELLQVPMEVIEIQLSNLMMEDQLMIKEGESGRWVYTLALYKNESHAAGYLARLSQSAEDDEELTSDCEDRIAGIEDRLGIQLDELQREAVQQCLREGVTVITGGPGTGKTTTIRTIITYFEDAGMEVLLAAPTGRAAKRMSQATGRDASTIHRMLEMSGDPEEGNEWITYERNEDNPLEADVIIVDEMSMVDIRLFYSMLRAIKAGTRLVLVGDVDQLPSVGPGIVLRDIIDSGCFNTIMLKNIFRQAQKSHIIRNAHRINSGEYILPNDYEGDFFLMEEKKSDVIIARILQLMVKRLPDNKGIPTDDIQVLTPGHKGDLGDVNLNNILQHHLNPPAPEKYEHRHKRLLFREGDRVMQIKNDYGIEWAIKDKYGIPVEKGQGIFNGDTGVIIKIDVSSELIDILFDSERLVEYPFSELDNLNLAYAITIHKSQGSEYRAVILPLLNGPRVLMNRNLLYTGVTRARDLAIILGSPEGVRGMIDNYMQQKRYSGLKERLMEYCGVL